MVRDAAGGDVDPAGPLIVVLSAVPPEETYMLPRELTVVLSANPPEDTCMMPSELTVVIVAVPPSRTVMVSALFKMIPLLT